MSALRSLLLVAAVAVAGALLLVGVTTPAGHAIWQPLADTATAVGRTFADHAPSLRRTAGRGWVAFGIGAGALILCIWLVPPSRTGRGLVLASVGAALLALALYAGGTGR